MIVSKEFAQLVRDAIGVKGLQQTSVTTRISKAYLGQLAYGVVPSTDIIDRFCEALDIDPGPFYKAAEIQEEPDYERRLHRLAEDARFSNSQRMKLLQFFRELREESASEEQVA